MGPKKIEVGDEEIGPAKEEGGTVSVLYILLLRWLPLSCSDIPQISRLW